LKGFTPALVNMGSYQEFRPNYRDGWRVIVDCQELGDWLFAVLRPHLPDKLDAADILAANGQDTISGINKRMRVLLYTPGQQFKPHSDGQYSPGKFSSKFGTHSRITVQLYLNDVQEAQGGATALLKGHKMEQADIQCQPTAGTVLLFTQELRHEGCVVHSGIKYTVRTEVMFTA
jgi:hypothetical protein